MCDRVFGAYSELLMALSRLTKYVKQLGSKSGVIFSLGPLADDQYNWKMGNSQVWVKMVASNYDVMTGCQFRKK